MSSLPPVYIVSAVRTPVGSFLGYGIHSYTFLFCRYRSTNKIDPSRACLLFNWVDLLLRVSFMKDYLFCARLTNISSGAVERVPEIKPEQVEEVFFGNVLSAKQVILYPFKAAYSNKESASAKTQLDNLPLPEV